MVAQVPGTLAEANALAPFTDPTNAWPAGAWVVVGGGISGQPLTDVFWNGTAFALGKKPAVTNDITEDILGNRGTMPESITQLAADIDYGNGRLSAGDAKKFTTGKFCQLNSGANTGKVYYDSGQSGTQQPGTGTWKSSATGSPAEPPDVLSGVTTPTAGDLEADWLPLGSEGPATHTEANTRLVAGAPANGFTKPSTMWPAGAYVLAKDGVAHLSWNNTTSLFISGDASGSA